MFLLSGRVLSIVGKNTLTKHYPAVVLAKLDGNDTVTEEYL